MPFAASPVMTVGATGCWPPVCVGRLAEDDRTGRRARGEVGDGRVRASAPAGGGVADLGEEDRVRLSRRRDDEPASAATAAITGHRRRGGSGAGGLPRTRRRADRVPPLGSERRPVFWPSARAERSAPSTAALPSSSGVYLNPRYRLRDLPRTCYSNRAAPPFRRVVLRERLRAMGAPGRDRTCDQVLRRHLLYPLSYGRSAADHRIGPAPAGHGPAASSCGGVRRRPQAVGPSTDRADGPPGGRAARRVVGRPAPRRSRHPAQQTRGAP